MQENLHQDLKCVNNDRIIVCLAVWDQAISHPRKTPLQLSIQNNIDDSV